MIRNRCPRGTRWAGTTSEPEGPSLSQMQCCDGFRDRDLDEVAAMNTPMNTAVLPGCLHDPCCRLLLLLLCLLLNCCMCRTPSRQAAAAAWCLLAVCVGLQDRAQRSHPSSCLGVSALRLKLANTHQQ